MAKLLMVEEYAFCAAHRVTVFPPNSRDAGLHGHTWKVRIEVEVETGASGYAFDHAVIDEIASWVIGEVDHKVINEIGGCERGLNEDIAARLGHQFGWALGNHSETDGQATVKRLVLTQLSSGRTYRLVEHVTVWEPPA